MNTSDLVGTIFILFVFVVLNLFNILGAKLSHVQQNWPKYRCNPTVIPFAGFFGHDVLQNFSYCIQNMQISRMNDLLAPSQYQLSSLSKQVSDQTNTNNNTRQFTSMLRGNLANMIGGVMNVFLNIVIQIQKMLLGMKDLFGKLSGIMATQMFLLSGSLLTVQSTWNGPPGQLIRGLCFHPDTIVQLHDGTFTHIKDVKSGDKLKNGKLVQATMNIHNLDANDNIIEPLYEIAGGEQDKNVLVTGSHLIYDTNKEDFIYVKDSKLSKISSITSNKLACLITENHLIPLGKHIFHDWEDNH